MSSPLRENSALPAGWPTICTRMPSNFHSAREVLRGEHRHVGHRPARCASIGGWNTGAAAGVGLGAARSPARRTVVVGRQQAVPDLLDLADVNTAESARMRFRNRAEMPMRSVCVPSFSSAQRSRGVQMSRSKRDSRGSGLGALAELGDDLVEWRQLGAGGAQRRGQR